MNGGAFWTWCWIGLVYAALCGGLGLAGYFAWLEYVGRSPARVLLARAILLMRRLRRLGAQMALMCQRLQARRLAKIALAVAAIAICGWAIWSHAGTWFASAPPTHHYSAPGGLAFENAFERNAEGLFPLMTAGGWLLILIGGALIAMGAASRAALVVVTSGMLFLAIPVMFRVVIEPPAEDGDATSASFASPSNPPATHKRQTP